MATNDLTQATVLYTRWDSLSRWERTELGRALRRRGLSYSEIQAVIPVAKSTLAGWCRGIRLTAEQQAAIKSRSIQRRLGRSVDTQHRRRSEIDAIRRRALGEAQELLTDPHWLSGVVLYWTEGSKTRNDLSLVNSDPRALRLFIRWVRRYLDPAAEYHLQLHLHEGNDDAAARRHWEEALDLERAQFYRTFIKPRGTGHRKNHLPHGVCRVRVSRAADHWQRVMMWIEVVADAMGAKGGWLHSPPGR